MPSGAASKPASFPSAVGGFPTGLSDTCSFTFSPARNRWYWHHEGSSTLRGSLTCGIDESIGFCAASYANP